MEHPSPATDEDKSLPEKQAGAELSTDSVAEDERATPLSSDMPGKSPELTAEVKVNIISSCLSYSIYEAGVYWQRNAIYITINSLMAGGAAALYKDIAAPVLIVLSAFALYLNWYWRHVNEYSKVLAERWRDDAREIARNDIELSKVYRVLLGTSPTKEPKGKKPSKVMNQLSTSFKAVWAGVLSYGIVDLIGWDRLSVAYSRIEAWLAG